MTEQNVKRGGCLTAFLILMLVANSLTSLLYLLFSGIIRQASPNIPGWVTIILGIFGAINFLLSLAIWKWKKWGLYGFGASTVIVFIINLSIGTPILNSLFGLLGIIILAFLVKPLWNNFE